MVSTNLMPPFEDKTEGIFDFDLDFLLKVPFNSFFFFLLTPLPPLESPEPYLSLYSKAGLYLSDMKIQMIVQ